MREEGEDDAQIWVQQGKKVEESIHKVFWDSDTGLFRAATVRCREHDIWGSAFAVYLDVADATQAISIADYFKTHYAEIVDQGHIRHIPDGHSRRRRAAQRWFGLYHYPIRTADLTHH